MTEDDLAQVRAVVYEALQAHGLQTKELREKSSAAQRAKRYRDAKRDAARDGVHRRKRDGSVTKRDAKRDVDKPPVLPDWVSIDHWKSYLAMRVRIKKPATIRAQWMLIGKLTDLKEQGYNPTEVMANAEFSCYQSFYPPKGQA